MEIRKAVQEDAELIQDLAWIIWPHTFQGILSKDQMHYMLNWMYDPETLRNQMNSGHEFYILSDIEPVGFMGMEKDFPDRGQIKIHKLYVLPEYQGKGIGRKLIEHALTIGQEKSMQTLVLNVNRFNKAVGFYKKLGFQIEKVEDIDIGEGYLMEDYVMSMGLKQRFHGHI